MYIFSTVSPPFVATASDDTYMVGVDRYMIGANMFMSFSIETTILVYVVPLSSWLLKVYLSFLLSSL